MITRGIFALFLFGLILHASVAAAETTMANIWTVPQAQPDSFYVHPAGGFWGITTEGEVFRQAPLVTDPSIRIHKFTIGTAYFYVSDRGFIKASSDFVAMSMYLGRA